jgi:hypothetical protein
VVARDAPVLIKRMVAAAVPEEAREVVEEEPSRLRQPLALEASGRLPLPIKRTTEVMLNELHTSH